MIGFLIHSLLFAYMPIQVLLFHLNCATYICTLPLIRVMCTCIFNLIMRLEHSFFIIIIIIIIKRHKQNPKLMVSSFNGHLICFDIHWLTVTTIYQSLDTWIIPLCHLKCCRPTSPSCSEVNSTYFSSDAACSTRRFLSPRQANFMRKWTVFLLMNSVLLVA